MNVIMYVLLRYKIRYNTLFSSQSVNCRLTLAGVGGISSAVKE